MKNLLSCGILFFFLPVLLVVFFHGGTAVWGDSQAQDTALMVLLYQNSLQNEELEALKAEAVVFRTILNRYSAKEWHSLLQASVEAEQEKAYIEKKALYAQAIQETANVQIKGNTDDIYLPYHSVSAGWTRDSQMIQLEENTDHTAGDDTVRLPGMEAVSVESPWDREAAGFQQIFSFTETYIQHKVFPMDAASDAAIHIQDIQTDSAGYVQYVQTDHSRISGDKIRELLGLSSSCFTIQREDDRWIFTCLGIGHGYGMSLYGCEAMAEEGKSCQEILTYYYPQYTFLFPK